MKNITIVWSVTFAILAGIILLIPTQEEEIKIEEPGITLTHQQEVWMGALEWCESRGEKEAINEEDLDGTPSYYSFQFKPGTFRGYGEKYGVLEKGKTEEEIMELLKRYDLQKEIVRHMVLDESVRWDQQFPWCVKKLGPAPKSVLQ